MNYKDNSTRYRAYAEQLIKKYKLNLTGKIILTEAASGSYFYNPMIALLANAKCVYTYCKNSKYGDSKEINNLINLKYQEAKILNKVYQLESLDSKVISTIDILTNSGHLRPLTEDLINKLKPTAVIPLMWEPWEMRDNEIDIKAIKNNNILLMGTNEHEYPCDMRPYSPLTAVHLMMNDKVDLTIEKVIIFGEQKTLAIAIDEGFRDIGISSTRISINSSRQEIQKALNWGTYLLIAEHKNHDVIVGSNGFIGIDQLINANIYSVGVISGLVNKEELVLQGISVFPELIERPGYMSYQPSVLGPYPVMDLFAAGLKVGDAMSNARENGLSLKDSAIYSLKHSPALDLDKGLSWI